MAKLVLCIIYKIHLSHFPYTYSLIARDSYLHHTQLDGGDECFGLAMQSIVFATPEGSERVCASV